MKVQYFLADGTNVIFQGIDRKKYRGTLLPGSSVFENNSETGLITIQELENSLFRFGYRVFEIFREIKFFVNERPGLRFEALLTGEINLSRDDKKIKLKAGQYHLTDIPLFASLFKNDTSCSIFVTYFSGEMLEQLGLKLLPCLPSAMPDKMNYLIQEMLRNPYGESLRDFYYQNCVRELLFFHLTQDSEAMPGQLEDRDIAAIYQADTIISSNLHKHFTIEKLSQMTGTNQFKLKKGFKHVFGMGVFHRLLFRRMEHAKVLLESTDKSIGEIAMLAGYDTAAGFIHAFRREFAKTPREWRLEFKDESEEDAVQRGS
ncbi:MAG TPA: AraC family transcriptional regulator [Chitinophagaceae bacterium]|nr:AraC family transcriptional regulator [Chitinophagaceae bacterium]